MRSPHKHRDIYLIFLAESPSQSGEACATLISIETSTLSFLQSLRLSLVKQERPS